MVEVFNHDIILHLSHSKKVEPKNGNCVEHR